MKETLSTIAERTGFSITTISRVLSGKAEKYRISKETAARIEMEAKKYNYMPSVLAQSLRTNKTHTIGLIIPNVSNPFFSELANAIISESREKGYTAIVVDTMEDINNQRLCISALLSRKVDGIIAVPCGNDASLFEEICDTIPVVLVDRYFERSKIPYITTNNFKGAFDATEYLINKGHKVIACIQGDIDSLPSKRRVEGYLKALKKAGLENNAMISGDSFSIQNGYLEMKLLLNRQPKPTAVFALGYTIMLGVMKALKDSECRIPEDISIISFDNIPSMDYMTPSICRVSQPVEEMGRLATKVLLERITTGNKSTTKIELSPELIIRESLSKIHE